MVEGPILYSNRSRALEQGQRLTQELQQQKAELTALRKSQTVEMQKLSAAIGAFESRIQEIESQRQAEHARSQQCERMMNDRINSLRKESTDIGMRLVQAQFQTTCKDSEVNTIRGAVTEKLTQVEGVLERMEKANQQLGAEVKAIIRELGTVCHNVEELSKHRAEPDNRPVIDVSETAVLPIPPLSRSATCPSTNSQFIKSYLELHGDVEVSVDNRCCDVCQGTSLSYRVRPRQCDHVFHVDCLLQFWAQGHCPCCNVSFINEAEIELTQMAPSEMISPIQAVPSSGPPSNGLRSSDSHTTQRVSGGLFQAPVKSPESGHRRTASHQY